MELSLPLEQKLGRLHLCCMPAQKKSAAILILLAPILLSGITWYSIVRVINNALRNRGPPDNGHHNAESVQIDLVATFVTVL